jgi:predicted HicB family RNase H-like nuclease
MNMAEHATIFLRIPPALKRLVRRKAKARKLSVNKYAIACFERRLRELEAAEDKTNPARHG